MKTTYKEYKERQAKRIDNFPYIVAFTNEQLSNCMEKRGLKKEETNKIVAIGAGLFIKKCDIESYRELCKMREQELVDAISQDITGEGFIYEMFKYELNNHEYGYTREAGDTLDAIGITWEEIKNNSALQTGFNKAKNEIIEESCLTQLKSAPRDG